MKEWPMQRVELGPNTLLALVTAIAYAPVAAREGTDPRWVIDLAAISEAARPEATDAYARAEKAEEKLKAIAFAFQVEGVDLAAEARALKAKVKELEAEINKLGHTMGVCYCTDQGCYTAESEALLNRATELVAKEQQEWDYHGACVERDEWQTKAEQLETNWLQTQRELDILRSPNAKVMSADELEAALTEARAREREQGRLLEWVTDMLSEMSWSRQQIQDQLRAALEPK